MQVALIQMALIHMALIQMALRDVYIYLSNNTLPPTQQDNNTQIFDRASN